MKIKLLPLDNDQTGYDKFLENKGWKNMEALLKEEMPASKPTFLPFLPYAATLLIGAFAGFLVWNSPMANQGIQSKTQQVLSLEQLEFFSTPSTEFTAKTQLPPLYIPGIELSTNTAVSGVPQLPAELINIDSPSFLDIQVEDTKATSAIPNNFIAKAIAAGSISEIHKNVYGEDTPSLVAKNDVRVLPFSPSSKTNEFEIDLLGGIKPTKGNQQGFVIPISSSRNALVSSSGRGVTTSGNVGINSNGFDSFGFSASVEFSKPIVEALSVNTGVRVSNYEESYSSTFRTDVPERLTNSSTVIQQLKGRGVDRQFVEVPVYLGYQVSDNARLKAGFSVTYNNNDPNAGVISQTDLMESNLDNNTKHFGAQLFDSGGGYMGEAMIGAGVQLNKLAVDTELIKGVVSNSSVDDRSLVGVRLSYTFGNQ